MTKRAYYQPDPIFGIEELRPEPVECEILEYLPDDTVRIRYSVPENALIFVLGGVPKEHRKRFDRECTVPTKSIHITSLDEA